MARPPITPSMRRALEWLPADGSWKIRPGPVAPALNSLALRRPGWINREWGKFGARGGHAERWRLTPEGVKEVAAMATRRA